jgi:hypothetical protein
MVAADQIFQGIWTISTPGEAQLARYGTQMTESA